MDPALPALTRLARLMRARGETLFYPDWLKSGWLPDGESRSPARVAEAVTSGLFAGAVVGVGYTAHAVLAVGDVAVLGGSPLSGPVVALAVCLATAAPLSTPRR